MAEEVGGRRWVGEEILKILSPPPKKNVMTLSDKLVFSLLHFGKIGVVKN